MGALKPAARVHGGPDALGAAACDLSTNGNACGPCPQALAALRAADRRHYPDPAYTTLRAALARRHGVAPARIVVGASASALIQRLTAAVALQAAARGAVASVHLPQPAYGDYAQAALAHGLHCSDDPTAADLLWGCEPASPRGGPQPGLAQAVAALRAGQTLVLDQAYEPLRLRGAPTLDATALARVWRLVTPNKALGLTGVRAAFAIAPAEPDTALLARVQALAPSWPLGAEGVTLLGCWAESDALHAWLARSRSTLRGWKRRQLALLRAAGWQVQPSDANFFTATHPCWSGAGGAAAFSAALAALRTRGCKLRDCTSFGLPRTVRMVVAAPAQQDLLLTAWRTEVDI